MRRFWYCPKCGEFGRGHENAWAHYNLSYASSPSGSRLENTCWYSDICSITRKQFRKKEVPGGDRTAQGDRDDPGAGAGAYASGGPIPARTQFTISPNYTWPPPEPARPRVELPERQDDTPILAWKWAQIVRDDKGWWFAGIGVGGGQPYRAKAEASCLGGSTQMVTGAIYQAIRKQLLTGTSSLNPSADALYEQGRHSAPDAECQCGFYGLASPPENHDGYNTSNPTLLLDVQFYGRVIVHDTGYRAEKQQVLQAHLPGRCEFCPESPSSCVIRNGYSAEPGTLAVRCEAHVGPFDVPLSLDALSRDLGCPVVFG